MLKRTRERDTKKIENLENLFFRKTGFFSIDLIPYPERTDLVWFYLVHDFFSTKGRHKKTKSCGPAPPPKKKRIYLFTG